MPPERAEKQTMSNKRRLFIQEVSFQGDQIFLKVDGRTYLFPLARISAKLARADKKSLETFSVSPSGYGIHWPLLDEDLSISELLAMIEEDSPAADSPGPPEKPTE
jgi:hypothetical protein